MLCFVCAVSMRAQNSVTYNLSSETTGSTLQLPSEGLQLATDGVGGTYSKGVDYVITISGSEHPCQDSYTLALSFMNFDINEADTLFVYDGPSTDYPLLIASNNMFNALNGERNVVYASQNNNTTTNALTVRLKTAIHSGSERGFYCSVGCLKPCEQIMPHISDTYDRIRNGVVYAQGEMRYVDGIRTVTVCAGDGIRLHGYADYSSITGYYTPSDATSTFAWMLDEFDNVERGVGMTMMTYQQFDTLDCHEVLLSAFDVNGCEAGTFDEVRLLVATNPIRTISNLGTVCSGNELPVLVSFEENAILQLDTVSVRNIHSRTNYVKTFIPDGPYCATTCYSAPVTFNEFPSGSTVVSKEDICSICVNFEHSYMGDYDLRIICPNGRRATLKYKNNPGGYPAGSYGGGEIFTGYPYGGDSHDRWDGGSGQYCDSIYNMYGEGLDYCFSRNGSYTLVDGRPANTTTNGNHYLGSSGYTISVTHTFQSRPAAYRYSGSSDAGYKSFSTKKPSNYENASDYYKPADDFSSLVGCPLNGTWQIQLCDSWEQDNGWVFGWSMDICSVTDDDDCEYGVGIDEVSWEVYPESGGENHTQVRQDADDPMLFYMSAFDTTGHYWARINITDHFGCHWDSLGHFTVLQRPMPSLGEDIFSCYSLSPTLDGTMNLTGNVGGQLSYLWSNGSTQPVITPDVSSTSQFVLTVTNSATNGDTTRCMGSDTINITLGVFPQAQFELLNQEPVFCEPFTAQFNNLSVNSSIYRWDFGDGTTSTEVSPQHTYSEGTYAVRLNAATPDGCDDWSEEFYITVGRNTSSSYSDTIVENLLPYDFAAYSFTDAVEDTTLVRINHTGCDSLIRYSLYVHRNVSVLCDTVVCENTLPLLWNGVSFDTDSIASVLLYDRWGADSLVTMQVRSMPSSLDTVRDTVVQNDLPYLFGGHIYSDRQNDTLLWRSNIYGCDSLTLFSLYVHYNRYATFDTAVCVNMLPLEWHDVSFFTAGVRMRTIVASNGADSVMTLRLQTNPTYDSMVYREICASSPLVYNDTTLSTSGRYTFKFASQDGCDSLFTIRLMVRDVYDVHISNTICDNDRVVFDGVPRNVSGRYVANYRSVYDCDSIITLSLTVNPTYLDTDIVKLCYGDSIEWRDGIVYHESADVMKAYRTVQRCDSVYWLVLDVDRPVHAAIKSLPQQVATEGQEVLLADVTENGFSSVWYIDGLKSDTTETYFFSYPFGHDSLRITLIATSAMGCSDTTSSMLYRDNDILWCPNVFTPGRIDNNKFCFSAGDLYRFEYQIFNRQGLMVFSAASIDECWDGRYNGVDCPQGSYVYVIRYATQRNPRSLLSRKGNVLLLR
ncbi:MAG: gliding motility-associated C-terminal domain-containing protein [Bacteroidales bacterium]|nr:gliding motility-associated C-terminal domain-containing protein [Bacteroidales bacterium]